MKLSGLLEARVYLPLFARCVDAWSRTRWIQHVHMVRLNQDGGHMLPWRVSLSSRRHEIMWHRTIALQTDEPSCWSLINHTKRYIYMYNPEGRTITSSAIGNGNGVYLRVQIPRGKTQLHKHSDLWPSAIKGTRVLIEREADPPSKAFSTWWYLVNHQDEGFFLL